jgi:hypothetical protein
MLNVLLGIDFIIYAITLVYILKIQKQTPWAYNYLIIACILNMAYEVFLCLQQLGYLTPSQIRIKEYGLLIALVYYFLFFQRFRNAFLTDKAKKTLIAISSVSSIIFILLLIMKEFPTTLMVTYYIVQLIPLIIIILFVGFISYYIPIFFNRTINKGFKGLIFVSTINIILMLFQILTESTEPIILYSNALVCITFNSYLLWFIIFKKGRYLND